MASFTLKLVDPDTFEISEKGDLGLFMDGKLQSTWKNTAIPANAGIIQNMLSDAFDEGKKKRSEEIMALLK